MDLVVGGLVILAPGGSVTLVVSGSGGFGFGMWVGDRDPDTLCLVVLGGWWV